MEADMFKSPLLGLAVIILYIVGCKGLETSLSKDAKAPFMAKRFDLKEVVVANGTLPSDASFCIPVDTKQNTPSVINFNTNSSQTITFGIESFCGEVLEVNKETFLIATLSRYSQVPSESALEEFESWPIAVSSKPEKFSVTTSKPLPPGKYVVILSINYDQVTMSEEGHPVASSSPADEPLFDHLYGQYVVARGVSIQGKNEMEFVNIK